MSNSENGKTMAPTRKGGVLFRAVVIRMLIIVGAVIAIFGAFALVSLSSFQSRVTAISLELAETATDKDLNVARTLFTRQAQDLSSLVNRYAARPDVLLALTPTTEETAESSIQPTTLPTPDLKDGTLAHYFTLVNARGEVLARSTGLKVGDSLATHPLVTRALRGEKIAGPWLENDKVLDREGLAGRTRIELIATKKATSTTKKVETRGFTVTVAQPVRNAAGDIVGAVLAGYLFNRDTRFVDLLNDTLYAGLDGVGTATVFLDDLRVSTNVKTNEGKRAIGTRVSTEVNDVVLKNGQPFRGRAFVVRDDYVTAYDPIRDINDKIIGILYVGVLERPFTAPLEASLGGVGRTLMLSLLFAALVSAVVALFTARALAGRILAPVTVLTSSAIRLSDGDLRVDIPHSEAQDELSDLQRVLRGMTIGMREMVGTIRDGIGSLSSSSSQITVTAKQAQTIAEEQAAAVEQAGSTIAEINATSQVSIERAQEVVSSAEQAVEGGQRGIAAVTEAKKALELIGRTIEIVDNVNELAEQSNVLAVNASIEAAQAGEHGRGFAVVAGEVRSLAGQSKRAARQIRDILRQVETSGTAVDKAQTAIEELASVLETSAERARQIAAAAGQQAVGMNELGDAMAHVVRGGRESAEGAKQLEEAVSRLSGLAEELDEKVTRYEV